MTKLLYAGEQIPRVCHIHESLRVPQPKASRHLAYLRRAGLVETRRDGVWVHYRLADASDPALRTIRDAVAQAVGRVDAVRRDAGRLQKRMGCAVVTARRPESKS